MIQISRPDVIRVQVSNNDPVGLVVSGHACVTSIRRQTTNSGDPMLCVSLRNKAGGMDAVVWNENVPAWDGIVAGAGVHVVGRVVEKSRNPTERELEITEVTRLDDSHPVRREINPHGPLSMEELLDRLAALRFRLSHRADALLEAVMAVVGWEIYFSLPAAVTHHHNYTSGLLHHSIEVAELALMMSRLEPYASRIDTDLIILGGLLHDIGKVYEYDHGERPIRVRPHLGSHIASGQRLLERAVGRYGPSLEEHGLRVETVDILCHIIESHHSRLECGSTVEPACMEAALVASADKASADIAPMLQAAEECGIHEGWAEPSGWRRKPVYVTGPGKHPGHRLDEIADSFGEQSVEDARSGAE